MDKNLFLAVALSILVYAGWFGFVEKKLLKNPPAPNAAAMTQTSPGGAPTPAASGQAPTSGSAAKADTKTGVKADLDKNWSSPFEKAEIVVRSHGASLTAWKFRGPRGEIQLVPSGEPGFLSTFPELAFQRLGDKDSTTYEAKRADGVRVIKELVPGDEAAKPPTLPKLKLTLENPTGKPVDSGAWTISIGPGLGTIPAEQKDNAKVTRTLALMKDANGLNGKVDVFKQPGERGTDYRWLGVDNRYFLAALLPNPSEFEKASALDGHQLVLTAKSEAIPAKGSRSWEVPFYVGAKGHTWLSRYKLGLERSIDFGFFAQLGRFVLRVLYDIDKITGNWGWSIILLTMLIQLVMFPATYKSLKAAAAMKKLQPEIARLQQRYSKDPQKLNTEMMALYSKHGANPLGGCLPMLVQMPIFYALYTALRNAWELHGQGWIFWIHDLSAKDPYYVLPVLMGGLMFAQNKLNPAVGSDPAQQQMMTFMPIIFTVMFMNFPSGLVLYWMTNSLVSTAAQIALRDRLMGAAKA